MNNPTYHQLTIATSDNISSVTIGRSLFSCPELLPQRPLQKSLIVTDNRVAKWHLQPLLAAMQGMDLHVLQLDVSEAKKTLASVTEIYQALIEHEFHRDGTVIALGGGVIGDLAGFAASTFHRGIDCWQLPTTLLAQVDSSVGGKTGFNHLGEKNVIGTFYQPSHVFCDVTWLKTLPVREYRAGLAEIIKYALLDGPDFVQWLNEAALGLIEGEEALLEEAVYRSVSIKAKIVADDEKEQGIRMVLNLGHTFAHALEAYFDYKKYLHGEAVALGLWLQAMLSYRLGLLDGESLNHILKLLDKSGFVLELPREIDEQRLLSLMKRDKKVRRSTIRLILLSGIGRAVVNEIVDEEVILAVLRDAKQT